MKHPTFALSAADRNFVLAVARRMVRCTVANVKIRAFRARTQLRVLAA